MINISRLQDMRQYFDSGATRHYAFRKQQLLAFKASIKKYENEIYAALYTDLKKVPEESWFTENGLLMQELNREANTLGSKGANVDLANAAIELKLLIEQIREQVQNLE